MSIRVSLAGATGWGGSALALTIRHDSGSSAAPYVDGALLAIRKVTTLKSERDRLMAGGAQMSLDAAVVLALQDLGSRVSGEAAFIHGQLRAGHGESEGRR